MACDNRLAGLWDGLIFLVNFPDSLSAIYVFELKRNAGQIAGISSTEFGLASMILSGVNIGKVSLIPNIEWLRQYI